MILMADRNMYGKFIEDLQHDQKRGDIGIYPSDTVHCYDLLKNWKQDQKNITRLLGEGAFNGVSFLQNVNKDKPKFHCYIYKKEDHKSYKCPQRQDKSVVQLRVKGA